MTQPPPESAGKRILGAHHGPRCMQRRRCVDRSVADDLADEVFEQLVWCGMGVERVRTTRVMHRLAIAAECGRGLGVPIDPRGRSDLVIRGAPGDCWGTSPAESTGSTRCWNGSPGCCGGAAERARVTAGSSGASDWVEGSAPFVVRGRARRGWWLRRSDCRRWVVSGRSTCRASAGQRVANASGGTSHAPRQVSCRSLLIAVVRRTPRGRSTRVTSLTASSDGRLGFGDFDGECADCSRVRGLIGSMFHVKRRGLTRRPTVRDPHTLAPLGSDAQPSLGAGEASSRQ